VSKKLQKKIKKGEYFSIAKLLPPLDDDYDSDGPARKAPKRPLNYFNWTRCFRVLMSIRLQHQPSDLQGMLRHGEIVQDLSVQPTTGVQYDAQVRRMMHQHPHIRWGTYMGEIVNKIDRNSQSRRTRREKPADSTRSVMPCRLYNTPLGCKFSPCKFTHKCSGCSIFGHPIQNCRVGASKLTGRL
jgi:hypothetical protein